MHRNFHFIVFANGKLASTISIPPLYAAEACIICDYSSYNFEQISSTKLIHQIHPPDSFTKYIYLIRLLIQSAGLTSVYKRLQASYKRFHQNDFRSSQASIGV